VIRNKIILKDLESIYSNTIDLWEEFKNSRIFITGGTGFFGTWFLESFIWANKELNLNANVFVLTRNAKEHYKNFPQLHSDSRINFIKGDVRNFDFPIGEFSHIIHAATTSANETYNNQDPLIKYDTIVNGTKHTLEFALKSKCKKFLYISSGSAYGRQPEEISHISENFLGAPNTLDKNFDHSILGEAKRVSELLTSIYCDRYGLETKIARCFSFVGPYLPLEIHYAIGNFIRDAIQGTPIKIYGDGSSCRSYMYTSDLIIWLLIILVKGQKNELYNVGSEESITIFELAKKIAKITPKKIDVIVNQKNNFSKLTNRYVPSTKKIQNQFNIKQKINLDIAIKNTLTFVESNKKFYNL